MSHKANQPSRSKEHHAAYYKANREHHLAMMRENYRKRKEEYIARADAWRKANPEQAKENRRRRYHEDHPRRLVKGRQYAHNRKLSGAAPAYREKVRVIQRAWSVARSAAITDDYVREQLAKYSPISSKDFPQALVEAKKLQIQIKRLLKAS